MIIDFHTHIFPDELAERAIASLCKHIDGLYQPLHNGTLAGLLSVMEESNIDISVVQPVITKASQTKGVNEWAAGICSDRIISFGGIYPHTDDYKRDIDFVVSLGLKGLKFHAEYQDFILDAPHMLKIYDYALNKDLILLHHGGADPAFSEPYRSSPRQFLNLFNTLRGGVIVAAHFGGEQQWDDVENILAGSGIFLDTSMGFDYFSREQFLRIVKKHGADKILFASDSPWSNTGAELEKLLALPLEKQELEAITSKNAMRILGLENV